MTKVSILTSKRILVISFLSIAILSCQKDGSTLSSAEVIDSQFNNKLEGYGEYSSVAFFTT